MKYLEFETENEAKAFAHRHALEQGEGRLYSRKLRRSKATIEVDDDEGERLPRRARQRLSATKKAAARKRVRRTIAKKFVKRKRVARKRIRRDG